MSGSPSRAHHSSRNDVGRGEAAQVTAYPKRRVRAPPSAALPRTLVPRTPVAPTPARAPGLVSGPKASRAASQMSATRRRPRSPRPCR